MKKLVIRIAVVAALLIVVVLVVAFLYLGSIVKKGIETVGPTITKTEMKLDSATLSALSGSGTLRGFVIGNPEGFKTAQAVKVGSTSVGVRPGSLMGDKVHVTHVRVESPEITFETQGLNVKANNLSKILDNVTGGGSAQKPADTKPEAKDAGAARKLQVDEFLISGARLNVSSTFAGGKQMTVTLPEIRLTNLGQGADGITAAELTKRVLDEVLKVAIPAAEKAITDLSKGLTDAVKDFTKGGTNSLEKVTKGVGDLFKKK
jgi:hypothetical protein